MNFENRWALRSALNFASDGEVVREVGGEFQRKGPEKAKADLAKECLTRVKNMREEEDDRKPGRLGILCLLVFRVKSAMYGQIGTPTSRGGPKERRSDHDPPAA
ncbi:hypothetical protein HELRODRAFT_180956 [Helobdella robusta]|uniref:Uncharacterized protein n=1 Tax=Helobdella robusta TaxID=6412 RepID=T1FGG6_HELRO|nr:hypothetical protein HELRODRAFT_180956 [Helobdella robusta]ESN93421.1 hypothetical protein HELRODRAFT_180956 [Helobdella robusta]